MRRSLQHSGQCSPVLVPKQHSLGLKAQGRCQHAPVSRFVSRRVRCRAQFGSGDVGIIGGGIMGLTTAIQIRQKFPNVSVDIIAEKDYSQSTSHGAAGLWEPYQVVGTPDEDINRWGQITYDRFDSLRCTAEGAQAGVQFVTCHNVTTDVPSLPEIIPAWAHIAHNFINHSLPSHSAADTGTEKSIDEKVNGNGCQSNGVSGAQTSLLNYGDKLTLTQEFGTYIVDQTYYLPFLAAQVNALGVQQYKEKVQSFDDLARFGYKCVFNCAGLGARELAADGDIVPVRGQVRRVRAPWVKHAMFLDGTYYILPNIDSVVVGGTTQRGDERTEVDWDDHARIWENILHVCPSLETAETVTDWVGLRPLRTSGVRLEREDVGVSTGVPLVHNYGHGGSGITLHWGCVQEAVSLVSQELQAMQASPGSNTDTKVQVSSAGQP